MARRRSEVEVEKRPDGIELRLPRRFGQASGGLQILAVALLLFGGFFAFAGVRTLIDGSEDPQSAGGIALMVGLGMLLLAGVLIVSRARIVVGRDDLVICEDIGPLVRRRTIARADLRGLHVAETSGSVLAVIGRPAACRGPQIDK